MDANTRDIVQLRAGHRCEYCHIPDSALDLPFHVEHIIANVHRADDSLVNLAWACPRCNLRKGSNLSTIDIDTDEMVELFNPRSMMWREHFFVLDGTIRGLTPCGRGTARLLDMNSESRVQLRRQLALQGYFGVD